MRFSNSAHVREKNMGENWPKPESETTNATESDGNETKSFFTVYKEFTPNNSVAAMPNLFAENSRAIRILYSRNSIASFNSFCWKVYADFTEARIKIAYIDLYISRVQWLYFEIKRKMPRSKYEADNPWVKFIENFMPKIGISGSIELIERSGTLN